MTIEVCVRTARGEEVLEWEEGEYAVADDGALTIQDKDGRDIGGVAVGHWTRWTYEEQAA